MAVMPAGGRGAQPIPASTRRELSKQGAKEGVALPLASQGAGGRERGVVVVSQAASKRDGFSGVVGVGAQARRVLIANEARWAD
eukprot:1849900-Prymnesium_polylepis.1